MSQNDDEMYSAAGISRGECVICDAPFWAEFGYQKMGVCASCAKLIAHELVMAHGGDPDPRFSPVEAFATRGARSKSKKPIPGYIRKAVFERDAYRCKKCGDYHDLHADHIFPESRGGEATLDNLQTLCRPCNVRKGAKIEGGLNNEQ